MSRSTLAAALALMALALAAIAEQGASPPVAPTVIVGSSMLGEAATWLLGPATDVGVVTLVAGGGCPGHTDLSPSQLPLLRQACLVMVHDFQTALARRVAGVAPGVRVIVVEADDASLLDPAAFRRLLEQALRALTGRLPGKELALNEGFRRGLQRLTGLEAALDETRRGLQGRAVVVDLRQEAFCRRLGLSVVGLLPGPGDPSPGSLLASLPGKADLVVGNLQSGLAPARSMAGSLGVDLVVLSNFPDAEGFGRGYADLLTENLRRL